LLAGGRSEAWEEMALFALAAERVELQAALAPGISAPESGQASGLVL